MSASDIPWWLQAGAEVHVVEHDIVADYDKKRLVVGEYSGLLGVQYIKRRTSPDKLRLVSYWNTERSYSNAATSYVKVLDLTAGTQPLSTGTQESAAGPSGPG